MIKCYRCLPIFHFAKRLPEILENGENGLPGIFRQLIQRLGEQQGELDRQVKELEAQIQAWHRDSEASRKLAAIPGLPVGRIWALDYAGFTIQSYKKREKPRRRLNCTFNVRFIDARLFVTGRLKTNLGYWA